MLCIGDIHISVSDFTLALRFWEDGLGLKLIEKEVSQHAAYAQLEFPDGGPAICLWWPVEPWDPDVQPPPGKYPGVHFDIAASDFDATLLRLLEHGGQQLDEIENYGGLRAATLSDPDGNTFELLEIREEDEDEEGDEDEEEEGDEDEDEGDEPPSSRAQPPSSREKPPSPRAKPPSPRAKRGV